MVALHLHGCTQAFSSCSAQASHCSGFSRCGALALGTQASAVGMWALKLWFVDSSALTQ